MNKIILASQSPRRREILSMLNIPFDIEPADINEKIDYSKPLEKEIEKLAYQKANHIFNKHKDSIVIGSDTIVVVDNQVLGKPKNREDAYKMLKMLENNVHEVITGAAIISKEKTIIFHNTSKVTFNKMTDEEIYEYIDTKEPMDKAGAYGIQGLGCKYIKSISGDYYSIMGLPISEIYNYLKEFK